MRYSLSVSVSIASTLAGQTDAPHSLLTMPNRLAQRDQSVPAAARAQPGGLVSVGREALERARARDKPILLSIGYAACHWCHVMEHESFEDEATAALMNEQFVNIKVDREERPDLDGDLHAGGAGDDGPRRLADDGVPHAGRRAVLRRHVLPARRSARDAVVPARAHVGVGRVSHEAGDSRAHGGVDARDVRARRASDAERRAARRASCSTRAYRALAQRYDERTAASAARRSFRRR